MTHMSTMRKGHRVLKMLQIVSIEETQHLLKLAATWEWEQVQQIAELQKALRKCEAQATKTCNDLRRQLADVKEKAKSIWQTNRENLARPDELITAQD